MSWGEYVHGKWRTVKHFCRSCFPDRVRGPLIDHTAGCGCAVTLVGYGGKLPNWLTIEGEAVCESKSK